MPATPGNPVTSDLRPAPWYALWNNPIAQRCRRARLRPQHLLTYGILGLTVTAFIFLTIYLPATFRANTTAANAAKFTLAPLMVLQGIILMGMGTAAIATGIARERDRDLLDYQRMTPMRPTAKILGYLFGLPAREYFLFAITVPFVVYAVVVADLPMIKIAKFYLVFFTSVWTYHMTGLCAGMVSKKPWQASIISLGAVGFLYLVLPNLSFAGLGFFEHLTARPTFVNMIAEELQNQSHHGWQNNAWIRRYADVPFFNFRLNPMLFSLLLQGFVLFTLFIVVRRKWIDAGWHPFSKRFGLLFTLVVHLLIVGSLWPTLRDENLFRQIMKNLSSNVGPQVFGWLLGLYLALSTVTVAFVTYLITPGQHNARKGFRRARKLGKKTTPAPWDAAPALRWVVALLLISLAGYAVVIASAQTTSRIFQGPLHWPWILAPLAVMVPALLFFHGVAERFSTRVLGLVLFVLWGLPLMVAIIVVASTDSYITALYIGSLSPLVPGALSLGTLTLETGVPISHFNTPFSDELRPHIPAMIALFSLGYTLLTIFIQSNRLNWMRKWRATESQP